MAESKMTEPDAAASKKFATIDAYIASHPKDTRVILEAIRRMVLKAAPAATEAISYQMPTLKLGGKAVLHFAAWQHHVALYGVPVVEDSLERRLAPYREPKGTLKFPLNEYFPYELLERLVPALVERRAGAETS